jgi:hypothetical protein
MNFFVGGGEHLFVFRGVICLVRCLIDRLVVYLAYLFVWLISYLFG